MAEEGDEKRTRYPQALCSHRTKRFIRDLAERLAKEARMNLSINMKPVERDALDVIRRIASRAIEKGDVDILKELQEAHTEEVEDDDDVES